MPQEGNTWIVQGGDNLERIAQQVYGNQRMYIEIARMNGGQLMLHPGDVLTLPANVENPYIAPRDQAVNNAGAYNLNGYGANTTPTAPTTTPATTTGNNAPGTTTPGNFGSGPRRYMPTRPDVPAKGKLASSINGISTGGLNNNFGQLAQNLPGTLSNFSNQLAPILNGITSASLGDTSGLAGLNLFPNPSPRPNTVPTIQQVTTQATPPQTTPPQAAPKTPQRPEWAYQRGRTLSNNGDIYTRNVRLTETDPAKRMAEIQTMYISPFVAMQMPVSEASVRRSLSPEALLTLLKPESQGGYGYAYDGQNHLYYYDGVGSGSGGYGAGSSGEGGEGGYGYSGGYGGGYSGGGYSPYGGSAAYASINIRMATG